MEISKGSHASHKSLTRLSIKRQLKVLSETHEGLMRVSEGIMRVS